MDAFFGHPVVQDVLVYMLSTSFLAVPGLLWAVAWRLSQMNTAATNAHRRIEGTLEDHKKWFDEIFIRLRELEKSLSRIQGQLNQEGN